MKCVCFACTEFRNDSAFVYRNWKKISKLAKHGTSENHVKAMTRWLEFKAMEKKKTSILMLFFLQKTCVFFDISPKLTVNIVNLRAITGTIDWGDYI